MNGAVPQNKLKYFNFNSLPKSFTTPQACIDTYNDLCY